MAYTKSPVTSTYSTERLTLTPDLELLPGSTDLAVEANGAMLNVLPFKEVDGTMYAQTRNAIRAYKVANSSMILRGAHVWQKGSTIYYYVVVSDETNTYVYTATSPNGTWTVVNTLVTTSTSPARFTEFIDSTNVKKLVMVDGVFGYVYTDNTSGTQITDSDFPTPHIPFPVFLDGYLFLAKSGTGDIYNSNLNDPALWTAGDFISSELYPDDIQALIKINNYILAIGQNGSEYFYDAANATASPLARYEGASLPFGTVLPESIAYNEDTVILIANNNDGGFVFKLIEGFKHSDIPAITVTRAFGTEISAGMLSNAKTTRAYFIRQNGTLFYVFQFYQGQRNAQNNKATVYFSLSTKLWGLLQAGSSGAAYPIYYAGQASTSSIFTYVAGFDASSVFFGTLSASHSQDTFDGNTSQATNIKNEIRIPSVDFSTMNVKTMHRLGIYYNRVGDSSGSNTAILVEWANDNRAASYPFTGYLAGYANYPGVGTVGFPFLTQLGQFRWRQFKLSTTGLTNWYFMECDINKGQQ